MTKQTQTIQLSFPARSVGYSLRIGSGIITRELTAYLKKRQPTRTVLVTNRTIARLYGDLLREIQDAAADHNIHPVIIKLPDGEKYKSFRTYRRLLSRMLDLSLDRNSLVVAFGGGVIGDLTGFAAATYMRGIDCVQVPTTLLAMVDSSIGGKTAINAPQGKNMVGVFSQPVRVIIDVNFLSTLPEREFRAGMAEVVKHALIADSRYFGFLDKHRDDILRRSPDALIKVVATSCRIKAHVVQEDEKEAGRRAVLNFGHTAGHAIEKMTKYRAYLHGEAVIAGMAIALMVSLQRRLIPRKTFTRIMSLFTAYRFTVPGSMLNVEGILRHVGADKKKIGENLKFILLNKLGGVIILQNLPLIELRKSIIALKEYYDRDSVHY